MSRWIAAGVIGTIVAGLLAWQLVRERRIEACQSTGGIWNGARSRCDPAPGRPILRRGIERT